MDLDRQLRGVYAYAFAGSLRLTDAVWVVLLTARGFPLWQAGAAESVFHITSLLAEVPSGMAADLLGRRRTLMLSGVLAALSGLTMAFSGNFAAVCAAMALKALSYNMISGTQEALTYDSLKAAGRQDTYLQVDANVSLLQNLAAAVGQQAAVLTQVMSYVGLYLVEACAGLTRTLAALTLREPVVTDRQAGRARYRLRDFPARLARHARDTAAFLRGNPRVARIILANAAVTLPSYLNIMFLQQRFVDLGWPTAALGLPLLAIGLCGMAGTALGRHLPQGHLRRYFTVCALLCGLGTFLVGAAPAAGAAAGGMLVSAALSVWMLHVQKQLNDAYPSDQRATLVSVDGMAYSLLMVPAGPLVGWLGDRTGASGAGLCVLGICVALCGLTAALGCKRQSC